MDAIILTDRRGEMKYIIKIHRRNKLTNDVSKAMGKIFQDGWKEGQLVVVESIATFETVKKLTKAQIAKMERESLAKAKKLWKPETIDKVEIVLILAGEGK
jgi:LAS superfamily LD-carboxypeptidase LdcB